MSLHGSNEDDISNWFVDDIIRKVGSATQSSFWKDPWLETIPLKTKFPGLLSNLVQSDGLVRGICLVFNEFWFGILGDENHFFLEFPIFKELLSTSRRYPFPG